MMRRAKLSIYLFLSVFLVAGAACVPTSTPEVIAPATSEPGVVTIEPSATPLPASSPTSRPSSQPTLAPVPSVVPASPTAIPTEPAQSSPSPTANVAPSPTAAPEPPGDFSSPDSRLKVSETSITIPTYGYERAFQATTPDDPIYPYPRVDPGSVTPPEPRRYQAIMLENDYVSLTVLPELGGRIYRWIDKSTGCHLLYENPVVKPTQWGYRGWWLGAGGIEWAFPVEEHGLNEWRPWSYTIDRTDNGFEVTVSDTEDRTGMVVGATIALDADHSYVTISPWVKNVTDREQRFQYWLNAMLALGDNHVSPNTRIILPADQVIVHSTGDESLPAAWQPMSWPIYEDRDLSSLGTWTNYLGFFVPQVSAGFVGLYDEEADHGIVRSFTPGSPAGTKVFGPGTLPSWLWTDDDSTYVELWSGITPTFADTTVLQPGASVTWTERWYPVHGIGSLQMANASAALSLGEADGTVVVGATATSATVGSLHLYVGGKVANAWDLTLVPGETFRASLSLQPAGALGLALLTTEGETVVQMGSVP